MFYPHKVVSSTKPRSDIQILKILILNSLYNSTTRYIELIQLDIITEFTTRYRHIEFQLDISIIVINSIYRIVSSIYRVVNSINQVVNTCILSLKLYILF